MLINEAFFNSGEKVFSDLKDGNIDKLNFAKIFYEAVINANEDLISKLVKYQIVNSSKISQYSFLKDFSISEIKEFLTILINHLGVDIVFKSTYIQSYTGKKLIADPLKKALITEEYTIIGEVLSSILNVSNSINLANYRVFGDINTLFAHQSIFLDHPKNPISPNNFLKLVLLCNPNDREYKDLVRKLFDLALSRGADFEAALDNEYEIVKLEFLNANKDKLGSLFPNLLLKLAIVQKPGDVVNDIGFVASQQKQQEILDLIQLAQDNGADSNLIMNDVGLNGSTVLEHAFIEGNFECLDKLLSLNAKISTEAWARGILNNSYLEFVVNAIQRFPDSFSPEHIFQFVRSMGSSVSTAQKLIDLYNLANDFLKSTTLQHISLSADEILLLNPVIELQSLNDYKNVEIKNKYNFTPLQLALYGKKIDLAIRMIGEGHSVTEKNKNGITALNIINDFIENNYLSNIQKNKLIKSALKSVEKIDVILNEQGESLIDEFINSKDFCQEIISKTKDPLLAFFKADSDLFEPSKNSDLIHIAISHDEGFWSTGIWSWSRLAIKEHPNVKFHLVTLDMIERGGDEFIKQFDGWINPGGSDDYPRDKDEFTINDWKTSFSLIHTYQKALDKTYELNIPYMGMCAGAQNFALYHGGSLRPLKGYSQGKHSIINFKGTFSHFLAMNKAQQKNTLKDCEFPEIVFKGDTAHNFAAVTYKLGEGMELGAISEDGVAMTYAHENGITYATQFHPEHYYHVANDSEVNHQKEWLDNFIHLSKLHHNYRVGNGEHPEVIFENIGIRLKECIAAPNCLMDGQSIVGNATLEANYFDS